MDAPLCADPIAAQAIPKVIKNLRLQRSLSYREVSRISLVARTCVRRSEGASAGLTHCETMIRLLTSLGAELAITVDGVMFALDSSTHSEQGRGDLCQTSVNPLLKRLPYDSIHPLVRQRRVQSKLSYGQVEYLTGIGRISLLDYEFGRAKSMLGPNYFGLLVLLGFEPSILVDGVRRPIKNDWPIVRAPTSPATRSGSGSLSRTRNRSRCRARSRRAPSPLRRTLRRTGSG